MDNIKIVNVLKNEEIDDYSNMINIVFDEFVGKDYSEEGNFTFKDFLSHKNIKERLKHYGTMHFIAKINNEIIGVLEIKNYNHISLYFVKKEFQGKGVGRKLFDSFIETIKKNDNADKNITVNSSIYAEKIYSKIGFKRTKEMQETNGIKYIPMEYKLL